MTKDELVRELALELKVLFCEEVNVPTYTTKTEPFMKLAYWVIADRARIVAPLEIMNDPKFPKMTSNGQLNALWDAGEETLRRAWVSEGAKP